MKKTKFGRTNLLVSELCLGTGRLGLLVDRAAAYSVLDTFVEQGGNFIQVSAQSYLPSMECGSVVAETLVGDWLCRHPGLRESLVFCARIRCPQALSGLALENSIREQIEKTLKRLGTNYLDIALLDWSSGVFPSYEIMTVMERLSDAGLLRFVGAIGFPCWRIAEWLGRGTRSSRIRLESAHLDGPFTQCCLEELVREHRVSLVVRWPYASGYEPLFSTANEVFGRSSFQVGIAWLLSRNSICSVHFSPKLKSELMEAVAAAASSLNADDLAKVENAYLKCALPPRCPLVEEG